MSFFAFLLHLWFLFNFPPVTKSMAYAALFLTDHSGIIVKEFQVVLIYFCRQDRGMNSQNMSPCSLFFVTTLSFSARGYASKVLVKTK